MPHFCFSKLNAMFFIVILAFISGCSSLNQQQINEKQQFIEQRKLTLLNQFTAKQPQIQNDINTAAGYMLCESSKMMLLALGGQTGTCLLIDNKHNQQTVLDLSSVNLGVGLGATQSQVLITFQDEQALSKVKNGQFSVQLENISRTKETNPVSKPNYQDKINVYSLNMEGSIASLGVGALSLTINKELNDPDFALGNMPIKNKNSQTINNSWPYALPFLADEVIARGYQLPKPYGVGVTYVNVDQQMSLTQLQVGFNGNGVKPYDFVAFDTPITSLKTLQVKADMWLLPFMNVFATVGKVTGDLHADVLIDGNTMLEQLGENCQAFIKPISCRLLQDKLFTLPIRANVNPTTYGVGTILASAWQDWFFTLPINVTWSQSSKNVLDGRSVTITPRVGHMIHLPRLGRLSVFAGGNYLNSHNTVTGSLVSDGGFSLDYQVKQANVDRWNLVTGFNWDISSRLSLNVEYNGFIGSRDAVITGLTVRF